MTLPQRLNGSVAEAPKGAVLWEMFHPVCLLFSFFLVIVVSALAEPNGEISARVKSALANSIAGRLRAQVQRNSQAVLKSVAGFIKPKA